MGIFDAIFDKLTILKIIKFIIELILEGTSPSSAISQAATKFNMDESKIKDIYSKYKK